MLDCPHRGYILELLLTKLRLVLQPDPDPSVVSDLSHAAPPTVLLPNSVAGSSTTFSNSDVKVDPASAKALPMQLIAMSATLPNIADLARWLQGIVFVTDFRPGFLCPSFLISTVIFSNK